MKRRLFCYVFVALCAATVLPSCSDDENTADYTKVIEEEIAGEYKGVLDVKMDGVLLGENVPQNITIAKASASAITLSLKNFSFAGMPLGDIELKDCALVQDGENYVFTQTQPFEVEAVQLSCTIKANGTLEKSGKLTLKLDMGDAVLAGTPQNVQVVYTGTRLKGDESSEAEILDFAFEENPIVTMIERKDNQIIVTVDKDATNEQLNNLVSVIQISGGAEITPKSGERVDLSDGKKVTYTVIAADGTVNEYILSVAGRSTATAYDFEEEWVEFAGSMYQNEKYTLPAGGPWGSTNDGIASIKGMMASAKPEWVAALPYAVEESNDAVSGGKSVVIRTLDTNLKLGDFQDMVGIPYNTAGSLFLGSFETKMDDKLASTQFGIPYEGTEPLLFSGYYKYKAGEIYHNDKGENVEGKQDKCDIYALLYEATDEEGKDVTLIGGSDKPENEKYIINTSPYVVLKAQLEDKTPKSEWTYFEIPFTPMNGKIYNPEIQYKITFVCTSSEEGATYNGAPGSELIIDNFKIITKAE